MVSQKPVEEYSFVKSSNLTSLIVWLLVIIIGI